MPRLCGAFTMGKPKNTIWNLMNQIDCEGGFYSCWPWIGGKHTDGYGVLRYKGKKYKAHRLLYIHLNGELPFNIVVRHICDNPACCNPLHLLPGTQADNIRDMHERNRARKGISPYKIPREKVKKILELTSNGMSISKASRVVGCSVAAAYRYVKGITVWD